MWVKKTKEELEKETKSNNKPIILYSFFFSISIFIFIIIIDKIGFTKFGDVKQLEWNEIFEKLPIYLLISFAVFILAYFFQKRTNTSLIQKETTYICDKCNKKKTDDGKYKCECGGEYIHINQMKWVDDKESNENKKME
jgi:hypothetical protein